jgi:hypothetical protein
MGYNDVSDAFQWAHGVLDWVESHTPRFVSRFFTTRLHVRTWTPPVWVSVTREIDEPFRKSRTLIVHVLPHTAYGVGFWSKTGEPEHRALLKAVRPGLKTTEEDIDEFDETITRERSGIDGVGAFRTRLRTTASDAGSR